MLKLVCDCSGGELFVLVILSSQWFVVVMVSKPTQVLTRDHSD